MLCPSCRNACLESDAQCPVCHTPFARPADSPGGRGGMGVRVFGPVGAILGAGAFTVAPIPGQAKIDFGQAAMAGFGAMIGGTVGLIVGVLFDRVFKSRAPEPAPEPVESAFRITPLKRQ